MLRRDIFDIGISGLDWVNETNSDVVEVANLSYSKTGRQREDRYCGSPR